MKSTVLFLAAFTFSGAVFAQQATVKTSGSMTTGVQPGNVQTTAGGSANATVSGPAVNSAGMSNSQVATAEASARQAIQAGAHVTEATAGVQTAAQQTLNAGSIGAQSGIQAAGQHTLKAGNGAVNAQANIHAAARQAVKVVAPVRMNTKISGGARLGIL